MTLSEYRETYSWQGAIQLGPQLIRLAEELPAAEEHGLSRHLRELMVEVPANIAADLLHDSSDVRLLPVLKLITTMELLERIYPALDTADVRADIDKLAERLTGPGFPERLGGVPTPDLAPAAAAPTDLAPAGPSEPAEPDPGQPDSVTSQPPAPAEPLKVPVS